jgi:pseudaminic acid biosynthesis-associated methylase
LKTGRQAKKWAGIFGEDYTDRNPVMPGETDRLYDEKLYGISRTEMNEKFIGDLDRSVRILEVGCNVGAQLLILQKMGFSNLYGIEIQDYAVELAKSKAGRINIIRGSVLAIPFKGSFFDLVFTSGVLIHISPDDIRDALKEIRRCASRYIWGFEYYSDEYTEISYRGEKDLLWKADFMRAYLDIFEDLRLLKEEKFKYKDNDNIDQMFLLGKVSS